MKNQVSILISEMDLCKRSNFKAWFDKAEEASGRHKHSSSDVVQERLIFFFKSSPLSYSNWTKA